MSVGYEAQPGRLVFGDALEMSEGGMFVCAPKPLPARSLLEVEIRVLGEPSPIFAIGRVIWTREVDAGQGRPSGMGVKLIDLEDEARAVIGERRFKDEVDADWAKSHQYGVTGVPTFVAAGYGVVGAQPYEVLEQLVEKAGAPRRI